MSETENFRKELKSYTKPQTEELSVELLCVPFKTLYHSIMNNIHRQDTLKACY